MPESPAFGLESPADAANNRKNGKREARKFGSGERGFQTGNYPRLGPFDIYQQRPSKKGGDQREGRTFYVLGEYPNRKPPAEGWVFFLARTYGPGTYRVHHNGGTERAVIYVSPDVVARASGIGADDDDDDDGDDDAQPNPPAGSIASLIEQINTLNAAKELLTPAAQPSVLETLAKSPVLAAMLAQLAAPKPNPPPAAKAPPDPYETIARFAREMGITPEQAIKALAAARQQDDGEDDADASPYEGNPYGPLSQE